MPDTMSTPRRRNMFQMGIRKVLGPDAHGQTFVRMRDRKGATYHQVTPMRPRPRRRKLGPHEKF
jgi:hypothetical protein